MKFELKRLECDAMRCDAMMRWKQSVNGDEIEKQGQEVIRTNRFVKYLAAI